MNVNTINNIFFQKKLVATAGIIKSQKPTDVDIYQLESPHDKKYMEEVKNASVWKKGIFTFNIPYVIQNNSGMWDASKCYVLEDKKGNCLGYSVIDEYPCWDEVVFIEAVPRTRFSDKNRSKKYIGETMMNFLAQNALNSGKSALYIKNPIKKVLPFYIDNCHGEIAREKDVILFGENITELAKQNALHTQKSIDFEV